MALPIYFNGNYSGSIPEEKLDNSMYMASRHIDSLTFNRIIGKGYDNLTDFQKEILSLVCIKQAEFEYENADILQSIISSYSINGVSMGFNGDSWNVFVQNGVAMQKDAYDLLKQTGLCYRGLGAI